MAASSIPPRSDAGEGAGPPAPLQLALLLSSEQQGGREEFQSSLF